MCDVLLPPGVNQMCDVLLPPGVNQMCDVLLLPGVNRTAVKYIYQYQQTSQHRRNEAKLLNFQNSAPDGAEGHTHATVYLDHGVCIAV
jgi:hypothetical protein